MSASIARYLKDFGEPQPAPAIFTPEFDIGGMSDDFEFSAAPEEIVVDVAAERAEAHAEGFDAARAECEQKWADEKQALETAHAAELDALRERYETQAAQKIEAGLNTIAGRLAGVIGEQTAAAIVPFLEESLANKAVDELADIIRKAMFDGDIGTIIVSGPGEMFEKLKTALGSEAPVLRHVAADDLDLSVDIDGSVLVTRLSAWAASLRKVLG
ncbi:hypothetical protein GAO09_18785 [Rhizobiales bacterium RZME27]|uniref:Uncharacterized protein n=1 Tax=Endobacterium cereale TaxID=2663029 RepID=A0A6A8ADU6_9HYPH|nr:hypothetical protein [Endobacterium cereale]MQY48088.1 hypothetical protein [Endobacterium cereale]